MFISKKDIEVLRKLGNRVLEIGHLPEMEEKRGYWKSINSLKAVRPMVLTELSGVVEEVFPEKELECESGWGRSVEKMLKQKIFHFENIKDDMVIEPYIPCGTRIESSNWGVHAIKHMGNNDKGHGSFKWEHPITDINEAFEKLHFREFSIDEEITKDNKEKLELVFDGILPIERRENLAWTQGLTYDIIQLLGLDGFMFAMYDQPEALHQLMAFMRDDYINRIKWAESNGLLTLNNLDDYVCSGGRGYIDELPKNGYVQGKPARAIDLWALSESQETIGVSPDMFEEFIFQYQKPVIEMFGLSGYGCCEPLEGRWHIIKNISNLRRVSISPWAKEDKMAEYIGNSYIYSRKPHPTLVSTDFWDDELIEKDIINTINMTKEFGCSNVEFILKDVHTVANDPSRLGKWTSIARKCIEKYNG